ncbi:hypothetical protein NB550_18135 [Vibrio parahaemolyticus]|uniref:hypothetical protein n=1 Tax=Vibrio parahaemolyticus TaxID=670 RepID=UPI00215CD764|nr:hypothetical protein [Vibrio parahaemolyticus]EKH9208445.1 hypothetical protein [Vibrio parahaemolyticus]MCR9888432.1 hypothetical protein [Vibrio parahaemolyticus]MCR9919422.1 hypothetical protein [Vibrio parahaemolyticus]
MIKKILTLSTLLVSTTSFAMTCEQIEFNKEKYGFSELNGLKLVADDKLDRSVIDNITFAVGANSTVSLNSAKAFTMYNYQEDGAVMSFETEIKKDGVGRYKNKLNAFKFVIERVRPYTYDITVFKPRYEGGFREKTVVWDTPSSKFVQGEDIATPVRYEATEDSIEYRNNFKCVNE